MTRPRLYLDVQAVQERTHWERGLARYVRSHAEALAAVPGAVARMALNPTLEFPDRLPSALRRDPRVTWNTATEMRRAREEGPLAYHVMSPFHLFQPIEAGLPPFAVRDDMPLLVTLFDLIPLREPAKYAPEPWGSLYRARLRLVESADLVLCISKATARDAASLLDVDPARLRVIGGGVSSFFRPTADDSLRRHVVSAVAPALRRPFVLTVGFNDERKNLDGLIRAYARTGRLRRSHQLVVAGFLLPEWVERLRADARAAGLGDDEVIFTNRVADDALRALYQSADLFVFPSRFEGFGLPVVEAVACGCPVITSNATSLPEILEWGPATFDPDDLDGMASLIARGVEDESFRIALRQAGERAAATHTWDNVARRTLDAVAELEDVPQRRPPRLRIAFTGRVHQDGLAEEPLNAEVVRRLARDHDVELFLPSEELSDPVVRGCIPETVPVFPVDALGVLRAPTAYDCVVHSIGDDGEVQARTDLAARVPGVVWLHDAASFLEDHGADVHGRVTSLASARAVLTTSLDDRRRVDLELVRRGCHVPTATGIPWLERSHDDQHAGDEPLQRRDARLVVVATGPSPSVGRMLAVLSAVATLSATPPTDVVFAGAYDEPIWRVVRTRARELAVSNRVHLVEARDAGLLAHWVRRADCVVDAIEGTRAEARNIVRIALEAGTRVVTEDADGVPAGAATVLEDGKDPDDVAAALTLTGTDSATRPDASDAPDVAGALVATIRALT